MSKKLTIPKAYGYPTTTVRINGRKEKFPTGEEITVTDEVYDLFQHIFAQKPKERTHPEGYVWGVNADGSVSLRPDNTDWNQNNPDAPDYVKNRTHWTDDDGTVHKLDAKYLPEDIGGGGGADWNASEGEDGYVKNRTHHGKKVDVKSVEILQPSANEQTITLYKVPCDFVAGAKAYITFADDYGSNPEYAILGTSLASGTKQFIGGVGSVSQTWVKAEPTEEDGLYNIIFYITSTRYEKEFTCGYIFDNLKQLDDMYIPDNVPKVKNAKVGQTVVVTAVDDDGKPIEWEATSGTHWVEEGINLQWDGDKKGRDVCWYSGDFETNLYKVSDKYYDAQVLADIEVVGSEYTKPLICYALDETEYVGFPCVICITERLSAIVSIAEPVNLEWLTAPSAGTYLADLSENYIWDQENDVDVPMGYVKSAYTGEIFHKLDKRFMPKEVECGTVVKIDTVFKQMESDLAPTEVFSLLKEKGSDAINLKLHRGGNPMTFYSCESRSDRYIWRFLEFRDTGLESLYVQLNSDGSIEVATEAKLTATKV